MAQLKQLSAGSSQIIMMMFRDKNNAPIKADSVHVKGCIDEVHRVGKCSTNTGIGKLQ